MDLHEEVGPARTTVSEIARRAGVQRLTVYRHFPDDEALLEACTGTWLAEHPLPTPEAWAGHADPETRAVAALRAHYAYYRDTAAMWASAGRDVDRVPALAARMRVIDEHLDELAAGLLAAWPMRRRARERTLATLRHGLAFTTWQSLEARGLTPRRAANLVGDWLAAVGRG